MPGTILTASCTPVDETYSPSQEFDSVFREFRSITASQESHYMHTEGLVGGRVWSLWVMPAIQESHCTHIEGLGGGRGWRLWVMVSWE